MRFVFLLLLAFSSATKKLDLRTAFRSLDLVAAIHNINEAILLGGPVDEDTTQTLLMLGRYQETLLMHADDITNSYEEVDLALRGIRTRYDVSRADLDIAINHAKHEAESYFKWAYINPGEFISDGAWLSYLGVTEGIFGACWMLRTLLLEVLALPACALGLKEDGALLQTVAHSMLVCKQCIECTHGLCLQVILGWRR
jgi:hypothetical protein